MKVGVFMAKSNKKKARQKRIRRISEIIFSILILLSIILFGIVISMKVVPLKFILPVVIAYSVMCVGLGLAILSRKLKLWVKVVIDFFCIILIVFFGFGIYYLNSTLHFMDKIKADNFQLEEYYVLVEKEASYTKIEDLDTKKLAVYQTEEENYQKAIDEIKGKAKIKEEQYSNYIEACKKVLNQQNDAVLISSAYKDIIADEIEDFDKKTKILYTIQMKVENEVNVKEVDVSDEPFNIYISGIDIYGSISLKSRSDVNMILTINPKTHKILMTSIPRDYYVQLHGTTGLRDKLTHAGIYGINMSIQTIQDILDVDINYYVRVNFTTLISLVDAIGGIDVYSDTAFRAYTDASCHYKVGMMHLDGKCALAFARERYAYSTGDRHRVQNQQDVLSAILKKALSSKTLITKYTKILESMGSSFQMNIPSSSIYDLVNKQLDSMPNWTFENYSVNGTDKKAFTYSYAGQELYVMEPDMKTVEEARNKIDAIMEGK